MRLESIRQRGVDPQHGIALATEGVIQLHHDLASPSAALQESKDLLKGRVDMS